MKKKWLGLAAILAAAAVTAVALFWLDRSEPQPSGSGSVADLLSGAAVTRVEVESGSESYALVWQGQGIAVEGMEGLPMNASRLRAAMNCAQELSSSSFVSQGDLAAYGLDEPVADVRVYRKDGGEDFLQIGSAAPGGAGYYATVDGQNVYLMAAEDAALFVEGALAFADLTVTEGTSDSVYTALSLEGQVPQRPFTVSLAEDQPQDALFAVFDIAGPVNAPANTQLLVDTFQPAFGLRASGIQAVARTPEELAEWGLQEPYSVLTVTPEEGDEFTLQASRPGEDGTVYLVRDNIPLVYRLDASQLPWLEVQPFDIMSKVALSPHIETVQSIEVRTTDIARQITLEGSGETLTAAVDGQTVDIGQLRRYYQLLLSASYDFEAEEPPEDLGQPVLSIAYRYRDGTTPQDTITLYAGPPRQLYIQLNDGPLYLTHAAFLETIEQNMENLVAGREVDGL